jgi:hypothetical protein
MAVQIFPSEGNLLTYAVALLTGCHKKDRQAPQGFSLRFWPTQGFRSEVYRLLRRLNPCIASVDGRPLDRIFNPFEWDKITLICDVIFFSLIYDVFGPD